MTPDLRSLRLLCSLVIVMALITAACSGEGGDGLGDAAPSDTSAADPTDIDGEDEDGVDDGPGQSVETPGESDEGRPLLDTFSPLGEPGVGGRITSIALDPTNPDRVFVGGDLLGIALTDDFGQTWQSTTGLASWEIGDITTTPTADGRIWAGSLSGPQSSADGVNWTLSRNGMPALSESQFSLAVEAVLVDPNNNARLLAFNGNQRNWVAPGAISPRNGQWDGDGSVWESTDSGQSWSFLSTVSAASNIRAAAHNADGSLIYAAVANQGVFVSTDSGASWQSSGAGLPHANPYDITAHPTDTQVAWVAMGEGPEVDGNFLAGGIWKTVDGGANWTDANSDLSIVSNATAFNTGSFHQIVVAPSQPDVLFTSNAPGQAAVYRSDDGGDSWSIVADGSTPRPNAYDSALRAFDIGVHPTDANRVVIGSDDTLLGSVDGGQTWSDLTTSEGQSRAFTGRGYSGLVSTDIVFNPADPDETILLGFDGGNFIQSTDGGVSWRRTVQDISAWGGAIEAGYSITNPDQIYVLLGQFDNFRGVGVSNNGGTSFSLTVGAGAGLPEVGNVPGGPNGEFPGGANGLAVIDDGGTDIVFAVVGGQLYRSENNGNSFTAHEGPTSLDEAIDVAADTAGTVFVTTASGAFTSTDGGLTFTATNDTPAGLSTLYTSASEPGVVYGIAFRSGEGGAYRFDGTTWERIFDDFFSHGIAVDPTNANNIAVVTTEQPFNDVSSATGVHLSNDGSDLDRGYRWSSPQPPPHRRIRPVEPRPACRWHNGSRLLRRLLLWRHRERVEIRAHPNLRNQLLLPARRRRSGHARPERTARRFRLGHRALRHGVREELRVALRRLLRRGDRFRERLRAGREGSQGREIGVLA